MTVPNAGGVSTTTSAITGGTLGGPVVQAATIHGGIHHHPAPATPYPMRPRHLPATAPHFTARSTELAAMDAARMAGNSAIALSGIAGVGKSALAVQWLTSQEPYANAQLYADLEQSPGPPESVLRPWLRALGIDRAPGQLPELVGLWRSLTADKAVHVLIDGAFEAEQVRPLLPVGRRSFAVVTSRRLLWELSTVGAMVLPLMPLPRQDAITLLRAACGAPDTSDPAAQEAAEALAEACACLPLPLVLTGARLRARPGRPLTSLRTILPASHLSQEHARMAVTTALNTSYTGLEPDAQKLYRVLGALPARTVGADLAAALCGGTIAEAAWLLEVLADEHLLDSAPGDQSGPLYRMGTAVRDHARAKGADGAQGAQETEAALRQLCEWMLTHARSAQRLLTAAQATLLNPGPDGEELFEDEREALGWLDGQADNLLPVLTAAEAAGWDEFTYRLVDSWWPGFQRRHRYELWLPAHQFGVAAARRAGSQPVVRQLLASWSIGLTSSGRPGDAVPLYEEMLHSARAADDVRDEGQALFGLGGCDLDAGKPARAREHLRAAITRWDSCGYPRGIGLAEILLGQSCLADEDPVAATEHLLIAYGRLTELQEHFESGRALSLLGQARTRSGNSVEGIADLERALDLVDTSDLWRARTLEWLGDAHQHRGDETTARTCWSSAADAFATLRPGDAARLRMKAADR